MAPDSSGDDNKTGKGGSQLPPLHGDDETSLDEGYRKEARDAASDEPAKKFGSWRDGRDGDGMRFPEEVDMRPEGKADQNPTGADATPGSDKHPISPPENPGTPGISG